MTRIVDASAVVAALIDTGRLGRWAEQQLRATPLLAPHLMPAEVANILRRHASSGVISQDVAALAHADLIELAIELVPYAPVARRIWELRTTVTAYDAWYVALAEDLSAPLATLDRRLARASGPRCEFVTPS